MVQPFASFPAYPKASNPPGHAVGRRKLRIRFDGGSVGEVVAAGACQHRVINQGERAVGKQVEQHSAGKPRPEDGTWMGVQRTWTSGQLPEGGASSAVVSAQECLLRHRGS